MIDEIELENESEKFRYWTQRSHQTRIWQIMILVSNTVYQTEALLNPISKRHFMVNVSYSISSIICFLLVGLSYFSDKYSYQLLLVSLNIVAVRQGVRCFDFEQSKELLFDDIKGFYFMAN
jgi:hypothetical protein